MKNILLILIILLAPFIAGGIIAAILYGANKFNIDIPVDAILSDLQSESLSVPSSSEPAPQPQTPTTNTPTTIPTPSPTTTLTPTQATPDPLCGNGICSLIERTANSCPTDC